MTKVARKNAKVQSSSAAAAASGVKKARAARAPRPVGAAFRQQRVVRKFKEAVEEAAAGELQANMQKLKPGARIKLRRNAAPALVALVNGLACRAALRVHLLTRHAKRMTCTEDDVKALRAILAA